MDNFKIETAQNITIQQNVAPLSSRIGAFIIDMLIIGAYYALIIYFTNALGYLDTENIYVLYALISLPVFFYSLFFETLNNGQTPGKYFKKIRVTKIDGSKPTFGSYLIRWILRLIDISLASGSIALLTILLNGKGQRLGDIAAGTTVISEKKTISINNTLAVDIPENYVPTFPQVTILTDKDVQTIKELYLKAKKNNNHKMLLKLKLKIIEITGINSELNTIDFIDIVLKDYNYFTQQM
ncbi:RDD family protein [Lutibacter sp. A80]|uniref:RDD family protein n=1 Tax=Lutibacter sp. A80 TaxID=2918453 RepID=UPI001F05225A|nr:RDD family protein [Lutibacter sp. A80]UMB61581.1 RDD family protein [Lutibacter sp. A80]